MATHPWRKPAPSAIAGGRAKILLFSVQKAGTSGYLSRIRWHPAPALHDRAIGSVEASHSRGEPCSAGDRPIEADARTHEATKTVGLGGEVGMTYCLGRPSGSGRLVRLLNFLCFSFLMIHDCEAKEKSFVTTLL